MVRPNRIKEYTFSPGSLTSTAGGTLSSFSDHSINGTIQKIYFDAGNHTATGSIFIFTSGANAEQIWLKKDNLDTDQLVYPFVYAVDNTNTTGSPQAFTQRVINGPLRVLGSGLGASKSGLGLTVFYV